MDSRPLSQSSQRYLEVNQAAYDALSLEYAARSREYAIRDVLLLAPLVAYLRKVFAGVPINVLDIGPGSGLNMEICHENGFAVAGIDLSPRIVANLRRSLPYAQVVQGDFVSTEMQSSFHGIISKASLHLFPKADGLRYLQKVAALLRPQGMAYISVTAADVPTEGFVEKSDYPMNIIRFKKSWTRTELLASLADVGLRVEYENTETESSRGKTWLNVYAVNPASGSAS